MFKRLTSKSDLRFQFLQFLQFSVIPRKTVSLISVTDDALVGAGMVDVAIVSIVSKITFRQTQWQATTLLRILGTVRAETKSKSFVEFPAAARPIPRGGIGTENHSSELIQFFRGS